MLCENHQVRCPEEQRMTVGPGEEAARTRRGRNRKGQQRQHLHNQNMGWGQCGGAQDLFQSRGGDMVWLMVFLHHQKLKRGGL